MFRKNFFEDCGEVVAVRLAADDTGRFKGYGHVDFATEEEAQNVSIYCVSLITSYLVINAFLHWDSYVISID